MVNELFNMNEPLDQEWMDLILDALEQGLTVKEIQMFLQGKQIKTV
jgi:DNA-binding transcriptional MerR regulator